MGLEVEVLGSKFRKPRTPNDFLPPISLNSLLPLVALNAYPVDSGESIGGSLPLWGGRLIQRPCESFAINCPHERLVWTTWYGLAGLTGSLARTVAAKTPT